MRMPKRSEKGFTLVELLIVLAILAVLAAVVIPNVTGMMGRGSQQAWDTDQETIQMSASTFYFDIHNRLMGETGPIAGIDGWVQATDPDDLVPGHYYPTASGSAGINDTTFYDGVTYGSSGVNPAADDGLILMGLLANIPGSPADVDGDGTADDGVPGGVAPQDGEKGPYLNEIPKSANAANGGSGTYYWIVGPAGVVYSVHLEDDGAGGFDCRVGFGTTYP